MMVGIGVCKMIWLQGSVTSATYIATCLNPSLSVIRGRCRILQHDNAKAHSAQQTAMWLASQNVSTFESVFGVRWPARSPDLSPVETVFSILQYRASKHLPVTVAELMAAWDAEVAALSQELVDAIVGSFAGRLRKCLAANGGTIKP